MLPTNPDCFEKERVQLRWSYLRTLEIHLVSLLHRDLVKLGFCIEQNKIIPKEEVWLFYDLI